MLIMVNSKIPVDLYSELLLNHFINNAKGQHMKFQLIRDILIELSCSAIIAAFLMVLILALFTPDHVQFLAYWNFTGAAQ